MIRRRLRRWLTPLGDFLGTEAAGGILLVGAAVVGVVWANSPWGDSYRRLWAHYLDIGSGGHALHLDLRQWVNDALMTIFFLVVGLEIKREMTSGHLATRRAAMLPVIAAIAGMVVPAVIFLAIADSGSRRGWGVPMATDIALALGVAAIAGDRVPASMRAFLLGLAIVDDIGAILVIAVVYNDSIGAGWLALAASAFAVAVVMRLTGVQRALLYVPAGVVMWYALHEAGVHPTLAGVVFGLLTPSVAGDGDPDSDPDSDEATGSVVERLEHTIHPWSSFVVVPIFALANSGIEISTSGLRQAFGRALTWAVIAGLVVGKPLGVLLGIKAAEVGGLGRRPDGVGQRTVLGIGNAAGIGFTVAIFVAELAFHDPAQQQDAKLGILAASVVSAVLALLVLRTRADRSTGRAS